MGKTITGFNKDTAKNILLDAGAVFVNYDLETDKLETAKEKVIGATAGGNEFTAIPDYRSIKPDGVKGKTKGLQILQSWEVTLKVNLLEFNEKTFQHALGATKVTDETIETDKKYKKIEGKNFIVEKDYIDNLTFMGNISGSDTPVIIQIFNCLNMDGLTIATRDGEDIVMELSFEGMYDVENLDNPPFAIYYPEKVAVIS